MFFWAVISWTREQFIGQEYSQLLQFIDSFLQYLSEFYITILYYNIKIVINTLNQNFLVPETVYWYLDDHEDKRLIIGYERWKVTNYKPWFNGNVWGY